MKIKQNVGNSLIPMYIGEGPNRFHGFMDCEIRKDIVRACYNKSVTIQQLADMVDVSTQELKREAEALIDKKILIREGELYSANIIIITEECDREIDQVCTAYHEKFANALDIFLQSNEERYKKIGFYGCNYTENSIRWMLTSLVFTELFQYKPSIRKINAPKTAWGEHAYQYFVEKYHMPRNHAFEICGMIGKNSDKLMFCNYIDAPCGSYHDFYGNIQYVNLLCDIARNHFDEQLLGCVEAADEMMHMGYLKKDNGNYHPTMPVYSKEQYNKAMEIVKNFASGTLIPMIESLKSSMEKVIADHTPTKLHEQISGVISMDILADAISIPAKLLIKKGSLSTKWTPEEMPTAYIVLEN